MNTVEQEGLKGGIERQATMFKGIYIPELGQPNIEITPADIDSMPSFGSYGISAYHEDIAAVLAQVGHDKLPVLSAKPTVEADIAVPAHKVLKQDGEIAFTQLVESVRRSTVLDVETEGGFINLTIDRKKLAVEVISDVSRLGELYGSNNSGGGDTVVLDTSSPNIAKQMHLGHLRSTVIGESLSRILKFNGYTTVRDNHVGDWGTQFGLLGRAVELWGSEIPALESDDAGTQVKGLLELYVRINQAIAQEKEDGDGISELEDAGRQWFAKLEQGDEGATEFWKWASEVSMLEFDEVYSALGVNFEYILGESVYQPSLSSTIQAFKDGDLTYIDQKGVVKVKPATNRQDALGIQKPDGASLYGTRDLATLAARLEWFNPKKILYVVGDDQEAYFKNLFEAFEQFAPEETADIDIEHVKFGKVTLPEGSMSTRRGNVVFLIDVLNKYREVALQRVQQNMKSRNKDVSDEEIADIAEQVAISSMIYFDLQGSSSRDIVHDADKLVSMEGNTGPSLQYSVARMNALLEKASSEDVIQSKDQIEESIEGGPQAETEESELIMLMAKFPEVVRRAADKYEPSIISEYLHELSTSFNRFYGNCPILNESDTNKRLTRIEITRSVRQVMTNGLGLLNIPTPEMM